MSADGRSFEFDFRELVADWFAGGGGASEGIKEALGRDPDFAINHNGDALAMHAVNHPNSTHIESDVWVVDPAKVMGYRQIGLGWFSPDCKHFSKAKGGKPVSKKIRGLAWVITKVAAKVKPRVIFVENVEEFKTYGPLIRIDGQWYPDPARQGEYFDRFVARMRRLGYVVEYRELRACDYGTPTLRKRLFMIMRRDGLPIVWPAPTHGNPKSPEVQSGKLLPWRTAAECIDWSTPCPSIFERKKPLVQASLRRITKGVRRYVIDSDNPFLVSANDANFSPFITEHANSSNQRNMPAAEPLRTLLAQVKGGHFALVAPTLVQTGYGERKGQQPRALDILKPLGTVVGGPKHAVVTAFLAQHNTMPGNGVHPGHDARKPLSAITASGSQQAVVMGHLIKYYGSDQDPRLAEPLHTATTKHRFGLVQSTAVPAPLTYAQVARARQVAGLMREHGMWDDREFVTVVIRGQHYVIEDLGMRMLTPRELATAQGFPLSYIIDRRPDGTALTKTAQVRMLGNAVCPQLAAALVRANFSHERWQPATRRKRQLTVHRMKVAA